MGKKGKKGKKQQGKNGKKAKDASNTHLQPGTVPGREGMGIKKESQYTQQLDDEWIAYLQRLRESPSQLSTNFMMATDLALQAFARFEQGELSTAADLLMNAGIQDDRATSKVIRHYVFTTCNNDYPKYVETVFEPMLHSIQNQDSLAVQFNLYTFSKPFVSPAKLLEMLDKCSAYISRDVYTGSADLDHATIFIFKALEYTALGRSEMALRFMKRAEKIGCEGLPKYVAVWNKICMQKVGLSMGKMIPDSIAQNVVDLKYLMQMTTKDDRARPGILVRLCNIQLVCGNVEKAQMYREQYKESIVCVQLLHPPKDLMPTNVKLFNALWQKMDNGKELKVSTELAEALKRGVNTKEETEEAGKDVGDESSDKELSYREDSCIVCGTSTPSPPNHDLKKCGNQLFVLFSCSKCSFVLYQTRTVLITFEPFSTLFYFIFLFFYK